jgi:hypothetical protein
MVPMFDEDEFQSIRDAYQIGTLGLKASLQLEARPFEEGDKDVILSEVAPRYRTITGLSSEVPQDVLKHRLSLVGPPCEKCGKELRTPLAKKCVECGHLRVSAVGMEPTGEPSPSRPSSSQPAS